MRKIEEAMCAAVKERRYWKSGNTEVNVRKDAYGFEHVEVRLHSNLIWKWNETEDMTEFTLAGWNTNTTRSRLNALGVDVCTRQYVPICNGHEINENKWYCIDFVGGRKHIYESN